MMIDKIKIWLSVLVLIAGVVAYYKLPTMLGQEVSGAMRWGAVIGGAVLACIIAMTSAYGRNAWEFSKGSRIELKKMIWPTRQETVQGTLMVVVLVFFFALFLWAVDALSFKSIYDWILGVEG